jgi:hypothetical protein
MLSKPSPTTQEPKPAFPAIWAIQAVRKPS